MVRQVKAGDKYGTYGEYDFIPTGHTVAVHWEDGGLWTHDTIVDKREHNHNG